MNIILIILSFQFLIFIHELGHFLAAKRCGVAVEEFSLGIPPRIISKKIKDTLYSLSLFPIGGYIKMRGFAENENTSEKNNYAAKTIWQRFTIIFAGPFFNLVLCFILLWIVFFVGIKRPLIISIAPTIGKLSTESIAFQKGIRKGDTIVEVNNKAVKNWSEVNQILGIVSDKQPAFFTLERGGSYLDFQFKTQTNLGLTPFLPPLVGAVQKNSPASIAGLKSGDRILSIDGNLVEEWADISIFLQASKGSQVKILLENQGSKREVVAFPIQKDGRWLLGISLPSHRVSFSFLGSAKESSLEIINNVTLTFRFLGKLITGKSSSDAVGGPVMIISVMQRSIEAGFLTLVYITALISLQLAIFNLLPIPALDGGYLFLLAIEKIRGKPLPLKYRVRYQVFGFLLLIALIIFVTTNDILRLIG